MKRARIGVSAIALLWSGSLLAAGVGSASFDELDADGDGYITQEEAAQEQGLVSSWQNLDTNEDGTLSRGEFAAFEAQEGGEAPQMAPPDGQMAPPEGQMSPDAGQGGSPGGGY